MKGNDGSLLRWKLYGQTAQTHGQHACMHGLKGLGEKNGFLKTPDWKDVLKQFQVASTGENRILKHRYM